MNVRGIARMVQGRRRKYQKICLQISMLICCVVILLIIKRLYVEIVGYMPQKPVEQVNRDFDKYLVKYENNYWKAAPVKKVVIWTPFFGGWGWVDDAQNAMNTCKASCTFTSDQTAVQTADAVLFHANDLWKYRGLLGTLYNIDIPMPEYRTPDQVWAVLSWEPMTFMWGKVKPNTFNWTMLYRRESTVYNPFTSFYKMTPEEAKAKRKPKNTEMFLRKKTKFASTMVSNCYDQAQRYKIIRELQRYVDVDNFGSCTGNMICPHGVPTTECGKKYLKDYKFYLAFENSFCRDYISEKFWNALSRHQIPVIAAPKYNLELVPPNSYLNVFDFPSIKALAERMIEIANNETLYNSFFDWMRYYNEDSEGVYCKFCKELHANRPAQSYANMEAWIKDDMCYKSTPWSLVSGFIQRKLFDIGLL
ncbi:alpha-(1,3)-fucosyltransferase 7-like [Mercenaria mercenaria]|uniref:alpha-(1,3)-fucosyltransferase 7-like n=1 Tax=Mercenaria mercenaria TaxID=6596 RepID=UPI001E1D7772|nr:alpha-(1,3)-fucosyltransferase 7-like [Mercenaria mercenaria]